MKKMLSCLLVCAMLLAMMPMSTIPVFAATSGRTGDCTWTLNGTHLTISGNGAMADYVSSSLPWGESITSVTIKSGVTSIGKNAFRQCSKLTAVTIPDTVTSIGEAAFCWCESLTAIDIPGSVTFIGEDAFWCCLDLKDVTFHEGLQAIDQGAFQGCRLITALDFPESLQSIGYWAFGGCEDLVSVTIPGSVAVLDDSVFSACVSLQTVTLNEGLISIGVSAFAYCFELQNVAIPGSVQSISDTAFYLCEKLGTVAFNGAPPVISDSAFAGAVATVCYPAPVTAWADIRGQSFGGTLTWQSYSVDGHTYADTVVPPTCLERGYTRHACIDCGETYMDTYVDALGHHWDGGVTSGSRTTYTCTRCGLKRYEYSVSGTCGANARWTLDTEAGILHITGTGAITVSGGRSLPWGSYISGIRHVVIDEGITSIGAEAFFECECIETIQIPDTVKSIGYSAFVWCSALKEVIVPEGVTVIEESTFWGCESMETLILPSTLTKIENKVFYRCDSLKQLVIPDSVTSIGEAAFLDCGGLEEMIIPASITELSASMFSGCVNLRTVHLPDTLTVINQGAFAYCSSLQSITIPKSVVAICDTAFYCCTSLKKVYIPGSVEIFGRGVFAGCSNLDAIYFTGNPPVFHEEAFWNTTTRVEYPYANRVAWTDVKQSYGGSVSWLYYHVTGHNYTSTVVEPTCEHRGYTLHSCTDSGCDFYYMDTYTEPLDHVWDKGTGTNTQWTYTCTLCGDTRIVRNITGSCGSGVYWSLNTEAGVLRIYGSGRMNDYSRTPPWNSYKDSIRQVIIESGVTSIGAYAFYEHGALETIEVPDTVHSLGLGAFVWCEKLQGIRIPEGVTNIPEDCFWGCRSLADLSLPSTLRTISQDVFYSNESLTTLELPENLVSIGKNAFWQCTGLTSVTIPKGVTVIPQACFASCSSLKSVTLHDGIVTIDRSAFSYCYSLRSLTLPKQLTTLGVNALSGIAVTSLVIPANVTFIDSGVFYGASLTSIHFKGDAPAFDAKALEGLSITAYYPRGNATWTAEVRQSYGGSVTWIAESPCSHRYEVTSIPPTCLDVGFSVYTCFDCGYTYQELGEPATGEHDYTDWLVEWEPSCDYEGYKYRYCIHCSLYEWVTLPALGHDYYTYVYPPTCYSGGYTEYWCGRCALYYLDDYTDPLPDHDYSDWIQSYPANCVDEGMEFRYCYMCGCEEFQCIPATGHSYKSVVTAPTCTEQGYTTYTCACGDTYVDNYVSVTDHSYGAWTVTTQPTCTAIGSQRRECDRCDYYETETVAALGHDEIAHEAKAPTCTEIGWNAYETCSRCDYTTYVVIPATGHSYKSVVTAPTCTAQGYTTYTCECGDSYVDAYTSALGHAYGQWAITVAPTCVNAGAQRRECDRCDHYETETVAAVGHNLTKHEAKVPTCTEIGWNAYETCSRCDYTTYVAIPATGHTYTYVVIAPTCGEAGYLVYTCRCGSSFTQPFGEATGKHTYDHAYDADCNACGGVRETDIPIAFGGNSVSEDVSGLAFRFDVAVSGMAMDGTTAIYDDAIVGGYRLLAMGAIVTNGVESIDIPAVYLWDLQDTTATFAVRVIAIPTNQYDTLLAATPYIVLEIGGVATIIYGEAQTCSYNDVMN